jgi:hypothetical protein
MFTRDVQVLIFVHNVLKSCESSVHSNAAQPTYLDDHKPASQPEAPRPSPGRDNQHCASTQAFFLPKTPKLHPTDHHLSERHTTVTIKLTYLDKPRDLLARIIKPANMPPVRTYHPSLFLLCEHTLMRPGTVPAKRAAGTPLAPSVEKAYYRKCIQLKRRLNEVEAANEEARIRRVRLDRAIMKMRLERAFLLEQLSKRVEPNVEGSDASGEEGPGTVGS